MRNILLIIFWTLQFQFSYSQYETGGRKNIDEFTDLFTGPVPKWSPNGHGYAFITNSGIKIRIGDSTQTISNAQNKFEWSNDGQTIIYTAKDNTENLKVYRYFLSSRTSELLSLDSNWSDFYPAISPGDSIVAYYSAKDEPFKIYYIKNGVTRKIIAHDQNEEYLHPKWSPQGKYLVYFKHSPSSDLLLEIIEFESKKVVLSMDGKKTDFYDWSPDEKEILVRENIAPADNQHYYNGVLARINVETKEKVTLTKKYKDIFVAEWSKKSDKIVFVANQNMYVIDPNGQNLKKIYSGGNFPNIHPNGQKLIFVRNRKELPIFEIDLDGNSLKLLEKNTVEN